MGYFFLGKLIGSLRLKTTPVSFGSLGIVEFTRPAFVKYKYERTVGTMFALVGPMPIETPDERRYWNIQLNNFEKSDETRIKDFLVHGKEPFFETHSCLKINSSHQDFGKFRFTFPSDSYNRKIEIFYLTGQVINVHESFFGKRVAFVNE